MKKIFLLAMIVVMAGCSSDSGYTKVDVSASEAAALSALSEPLAAKSSSGQGSADSEADTSAISTTTITLKSGKQVKKLKLPALTK